MSPIISIILPTYNRLYSLKEIFLPSLERQKFLNYELIIIDDGSDDGTEQYLKSEVFSTEFPQISERVSFYKNESNLGAPASRNKGVKYAKGEWVWIVEDDIQIDDIELLGKFQKIAKEISEDIGVISPKRSETISDGYYHNPKGSFVRIGRLSAELYLDPEQEYTGYVPNTHCSSFIGRELYLSIGGQDSKLFYGNTFRDESDFYFRIVNTGNKILYVGDQLKIIHRNDFASSGGQKKVKKNSIIKQEGMVIGNHYKYLKKNYNLPKIRIIFFLSVRIIKHIANLTRISFLKTLLTLLKI